MIEQPPLQPQDIMIAVETLKEKAYNDICGYLSELPENLQDKRLLIHLLEAVTAQLILDTSMDLQTSINNFAENVKAHVEFLLEEGGQDKTTH